MKCPHSSSLIGPGARFQPFFLRATSLLGQQAKRAPKFYLHIEVDRTFISLWLAPTPSSLYPLYEAFLKAAWQRKEGQSGFEARLSFIYSDSASESTKQKASTMIFHAAEATFTP